MPQLSRLGDTTVADGKIVRGASTVFCDGKPVGLHSSPITPHKPFSGPHKFSRTVSGSSTVICEGSPVLFVGCQTTCGHPINKGSSTVTVK